MRPDRKFFWTVTAFAMAVAALPVLVGLLLRPSGYAYPGTTTIAPGDTPVYYSYIDQGRQAGPFMRDVFTSENFGPTLWQPLWWLVGRLAAWCRIGTPLAANAARVLAVPVLTAALWSALRWLFADRRSRRVGFVIALFGGGIGGLLTTLWPHLMTAWAQPPPDLWVSEAYPFLSLWASAHFLLVTAAIVYVLTAMERIDGRMTWRNMCCPVVVAVATLSVHPFHIITWMMVWMTMTIARWVKDGRFPWRYAAAWIVILIAASPVWLYYGLGLRFDPLVSGRAVQNVNLAAPIGIIVIGIGFLLPLALWGAWRHAHASPQRLWLIAWAGATSVAMYMPLAFQRRLSQALIVPFAWLAVPAILVLWDRFRQPAVRVAVGAGLAIGLLVSPAAVIHTITQAFLAERQSPQEYFYLSPEYQALVRFMQSSGAPDVPLLASLGDSNILAGLTGQTVYVGHPVETIHFEAKYAAMKKFYGRDDETVAAQFARYQGICFILDSPRSRTYGRSLGRESWPFLQKIWSGPTMTLYRTTTCPGRV